jgi:hypothetical protein
MKIVYGKELYCVPNDVTVDYINILDNQVVISMEFIVTSGWMNRHDFLGLLLVRGLQETFPCKEQQ